MSNYYTENLSEFGFREILILNEILTIWINAGLPESFESTGIRPALNKQSGYVFLVNDDYQVAMMNGSELEIFHTLPYSGIEGFLSDLITENRPEDLNHEDVDIFKMLPTKPTSC